MVAGGGEWDLTQEKLRLKTILIVRTTEKYLLQLPHNFLGNIVVFNQSLKNAHGEKLEKNQSLNLIREFKILWNVMILPLYLLGIFFLLQEQEEGNYLTLAYFQ